jgi:hypothetical protein
VSLSFGALFRAHWKAASGADVTSVHGQETLEAHGPTGIVWADHGAGIDEDNLEGLDVAGGAKNTA